MVKLESFNAYLLRIFINCESSCGSLVTWLCGGLLILFYQLLKA